MYKKWLAFIERKDLGFTAIIAIIVSGALGIAVKFLGLLKEAVIANYFGISAEVDFYVLALLITTFLVGPIAGPYGTLLTQKLVELKNISIEKTSLLYCQTVIWVSAIFAALIIVAATILKLFPVSTYFIPHGSAFSNTHFVFFLPIAFFSAMSIVHNSALSGMKKFKLLTLLPGSVPLSIILCISINPLSNYFTSLLFGTLIGYILEAVIGFFSNRSLWVFAPKKLFNFSNKIFRSIRKNFYALFYANIVMAGCLVVDQFMASLAGQGAVSTINFGNRVPLGLISILAVIWTVLFPLFSELVSENKYRELGKLYSQSVLFSAAGLLILSGVGVFFSHDIVSLIFERGAFTQDNVLLVSYVQGFYFFYIPFYVITIISVRIANSFEKQKMVLFGNSVTLFLNVILNFVFIEHFGVVGISFATVLSYLFMSVLWFFMARRLISNQLVK